MSDEAETTEVEEAEEPVEKTFTQKDINRIGAREKSEGNRAGLRRALEAAGAESLEELAEMRARLDKADTDKLDETEKLRRELEADRKAVAAERLAAKADRFNAKVERLLVTAGVDPSAVAKVSTMVTADVDSSDEDIATAIADLQELLPQLFGPGDTGTPDTQGSPKSSDPGKSPSGTNRTASSQDRAQARLQERHGRKLQTQNP